MQSRKGNVEIRDLDAVDKGYALVTWREAHKCSPNCRRASWWAYKQEFNEILSGLVNAPSTLLLGAYEGPDLIAWLAATPGKRITTVHWLHVKQKLHGERVSQRRATAYALLDAAKVGQSFLYTFRGPKCRPDTGFKTTDEMLAADLRVKGVTATYIPIKEWLKE